MIRRPSFFFDLPGKSSVRLFFVAGSFAVALEILSYAFRGDFSATASRLWILLWLLAVVTVVVLFAREVGRDARDAWVGTRTWLKTGHGAEGALVPWLSLATLAGIAYLLVSTALDFDRIVVGQDATQQLKAGLASFGVPDWNYTGKAFLGYPNRQYVLAALPALVLGRTVGALQLGFSIPFAVALMALYAGLKAFARTRGLHPTLAPVATLFLLAFPYVTEYFLYFEQTLFPLCFTTLAIAFLLLFLSKPSLLFATGLTWAGTMMAACYTPALASLVLLVVVLPMIGSQVVKKPDFLPSGVKPGRVSDLLSISAVVIAFFGAASFTFGRSDRVTDTRTADLLTSLAATKVGFGIYFLNLGAVFTGGFVLLVAVYLVAALGLRLGSIHFVAAGWILGVVGLALFLKGFAVYAPATSMSRALITVPVVVVGILLSAYGWLKERKGKGKGRWRIERLGLPMAAAFVAVAIASLSYNLHGPLVQGDAKKYFGWLQPAKYVYRDMLDVSGAVGIGQEDALTIVYYTDQSLFKNVRDYAGYFFPNAKVVIRADGEALPEGTDLSGDVLVYVTPGFHVDPAIDALGARSLFEATYKGKTIYTVERIAVEPKSGLPGA